MKALLIIANVLLVTISTWWLAGAQNFGNDVSAYFQSKDPCKYWVLRKIQEICDNSPRRRHATSDRHEPLHSALRMAPEDMPPVSIVDIPNSWHLEELVAINRVRRQNLWQMYEKCCRNNGDCIPPTDCTGFED